MQAIKNPPRTIMEVFQMLPEGTLAELINGSIYMSPAPTPKHQRIIGKLYRIISNYVEENGFGEILFAPCDVYFDGHSNAIQPDIIFISSEKSNIVQEDSSIHGTPDMLIEVLSKGNSDHDTILKKELYQKFCVKEYWIVNPETKETFGFTLKEGKYESIGQFSAKITSVLLNADFTF